MMIFNSTVPVLAAAWMTDNAQQFANEDKMFICTGTSFKWVSQSAFFDNNKIVVVEAPIDAPTQFTQVDCSYHFLSDHYTDSATVIKYLTDNVAYAALTSRLVQQPYTAFPYQTAHTRAPPILKS